jgi:hypothetical protein
MTQPELEAEVNGLRELVSQMQKQQESRQRFGRPLGRLSMIYVVALAILALIFLFGPALLDFEGWSSMQHLLSKMAGLLILLMISLAGSFNLRLRAGTEKVGSARKACRQTRNATPAMLTCRNPGHICMRRRTSSLWRCVSVFSKM